MRDIVTLLGILYAGLGLAFVVRPALLGPFLTFWRKGGRPYVIVVATRLVTGAVLVVAAPQCRFPGVIRVLGILFLVSGLGAWLVRAEGIRAFWDMAEDLAPTVVRLGAGLFTALALFLVYAAS
jgi:hypothetical protein